MKKASDKCLPSRAVPVSRVVDSELEDFLFSFFLGIGKCTPWIPWFVSHSKPLDSTTSSIQCFIICLISFRKMIFTNGINDGFKI